MVWAFIQQLIRKDNSWNPKIDVARRKSDERELRHRTSDSAGSSLPFAALLAEAVDVHHVQRRKCQFQELVRRS